MDGTILCGIETIGDFSDTLTAEERAICADLNEKRLREFSTSRHLAKMLMRKGGIAPGAILREQDGRPLWPKGITGSISHSESLCFVAISSLPDVCLGIDIQRLIDVDTSFAQRVLTETERTTLEASNGLNPGTAILFSIKESLIKLFSCQNTEISFQEIEVVLTSEKVFKAEVQHAPIELTGVYRVVQGFVYSGVLHRKG